MAQLPNLSTLEPIVMFTEYLTTEIGLVEICANDTGVSSIYFVANKRHDTRINDITQKCKQQLIEYFTADRKSFELPLSPEKGTDFQKQVWNALTTIPFGQVTSYANIAHQINNPKAVRAVGAANGKNPISIIVPCHRVIGANGSLTGYAGGLERKQWLLQHESGDMFETKKGHPVGSLFI